MGLYGADTASLKVGPVRQRPNLRRPLAFAGRWR
jgi:hypothetical protein